MKNKFGFTLLELIAVIVILALVAVVTTVVVLDSLEKAKLEAFKASTNSILRSAEIFFMENTEDISLEPYDINSGLIPIKNANFNSGTIAFNLEGQVAFAVWDGKYCSKKAFLSGEIIYENDSTGENCNLYSIEPTLVPPHTGYLCANPGSIVPTDESYFTFNAGTFTITAYSLSGPKDVVIPCTIGGVEVRYIGSSAFASKSLTSVVMPDSILTIASAAFSSNVITSVDFGNSITTIGTTSFANNRLVEIEFPDSLVTITGATGAGSAFQGAFYNNPTLTTVKFGSGLQTLGYYTFYQIAALTSADFSKSANLVWIQDNAFDGPKLTTLDLSNSPNLTTIGSYAFSNNRITSLDFTKNSKLTTIGYNAFASNRLTTLILNGNNLSIGNRAFLSNLLTSITFNGKIISIGDLAFNNNQMPSGQEWIFNRDANGNETSALVSYAGANRANLVMPEKTTSMPSSFFNSAGLTGSITIGNNIAIIPSSAFSNNTLTSINFGNSVTTLGTNAFSGNNLTNVILPDSLVTITGATGAGSAFLGAFYNNPNLSSVTFGSGIETIGYYTFYQVSSLTSVDFSRSVNLTTIQNNAFYGPKLTSLDLSNSPNLTTIGSDAFSYNRIASLDLSSNQNLTTIMNSAFANNLLTTISLNSNSLTIQSQAFSNNLISTMSLAGKIISIGDRAFNNNQMPSGQEWIFNRDVNGNETNTLVSYAGANRSNLVLPSNATSIPTSFLSSLNLTGTVTIGPNITSIPSSAFSTNSLTSVTIPNTVLTIGSNAFASNLLETVDFGTGVTTLGTNAFSGNQIVNLVLPDSLVTIAGATGAGSAYLGAFYNNPTMISVTFGSGIQTIGYYTFYQNTAITSADFSRSVNLVTIQDNAFDGPKLTTLDLSNCANLTNISGNAFRNNRITSLDLGNNNSLTTIGTSAFTLNTLNDTIIPSSVMTIGSSAFVNAPVGSTILVKGKSSSSNFTSLGTSWSGSATVTYELAP
jgi:prepilin-type N-terminal cleavage/methylation domain-containing protein